MGWILGFKLMYERLKNSGINHILRLERTRSSHHGLHELGYTRATKDFSMRRKP